MLSQWMEWGTIIFRQTPMVSGGKFHMFPLFRLISTFPWCYLKGRCFRCPWILWILPSNMGWHWNHFGPPYFVGREHLPRWVHLTKHSCLLRAMEMGIPRQMPIGLLFLKQHLQIFAASPTISLSPSMGCRPSLQLLFGSPICEEIHRHLWFLWGLPNISILDIEWHRYRYRLDTV